MAELEEQGAEVDGDGELDRRLLEVTSESFNYQMQFSEKELYALLGKQLEDSGYTGETCGISICSGYAANDSRVCNNYKDGQCVSPDKCFVCVTINN